MKSTTGHKLTEEQIISVKAIAIDYLEREDHITNRILRAETGINYDQAIYFFNQMISSNVLTRIGRGSGTRYAKSQL